MKKTIYLVVISLLVLMLSACDRGENIMFFGDKDSNYADKRMEQLFNAFQKYDCDSVIKLFSKKAILENEDINADIKSLFEYIEGKELSWSRDESPISLDDTEKGNQRKLLLTWYTLKTTKQTYLIFLADYPVDEIEPDNVGIYTLKIIKESEENKLTGALEDWIIPGIYVSE